MKKQLLLSVLGVFLLGGSVFHSAQAQACLTIIEIKITPAVTGQPNHWDIYIKWNKPTPSEAERLVLTANAVGLGGGIAQTVYMSGCINLLASTDSSFTAPSIPGLTKPTVKFYAYLNNCAVENDTCNTQILSPSGERRGTSKAAIEQHGNRVFIYDLSPTNTAVSLRNMSGNIVQTVQATQLNRKVAEFSINNLKVGIYILTYQNKYGKNVSEKIIRQFF
ncbi:MAG TPA: T9SS type A sorting domain-containing protein [Candidatus Paceibacterota bacterium]|nr:T9SS type A sorting domain-containing protein [Candidatus Paceibacterota bacterium]